MGAVIDDRNFRGSLQDILGSMGFIEQFDRAAGHALQHSKTVVSATHQADRDALKKVRIGAKQDPLTVKNHLILVGDVITTRLRASREQPDGRVAKAIAMVRSVLSLRVHAQASLYSIKAAALPKMLYGTQWLAPSKRCLNALRMRILDAVWGLHSRLCCHA